MKTSSWPSWLWSCSGARAASSPTSAPSATCRWRPWPPLASASAAALDAWVAELARQAGIAGAADPDRHAFEVYSLGMGTNSRFRLSSGARAFDHARAAIVRLEAELPGA